MKNCLFLVRWTRKKSIHCLSYLQALLLAKISSLVNVGFHTFVSLQIGYREYCTSRFGTVIDFPLLPDVGSESLAQERCKRLWSIVYPKEPYDIIASFWKLSGSFGASNGVLPNEDFDGLDVNELVACINKESSVYYQVSP